MVGTPLYMCIFWRNYHILHAMKTCWHLKLSMVNMAMGPIGNANFHINYYRWLSPWQLLELSFANQRWCPFSTLECMTSTRYPLALHIIIFPVNIHYVDQQIYVIIQYWMGIIYSWHQSRTCDEDATFFFWKMVHVFEDVFLI